MRHKGNKQYTFSITENSAHYPASWCLHLELQGLDNWHVSIACFAVKTQGHNGISKFHRLLHCTAKTHSSSAAWTSKFHWMPHITFSGQAFGGPILHWLLLSTNVCTRSSYWNQCICPQSVGYQLHTDSTILQYGIFEQHDSFLRKQLQMDVPTGAHCQGFFCLCETQLPSA